MKTVYSVIFLPCLIILLLITPVIGSSDDWVEYGRSYNDNVYFYNSVRIKPTTKDIVQVLTKKVYSDVGKQEYIEERRKVDFTTEGYDKLSHTLDLYEIDCKKKMNNLLSISHYDMDNKILYHHSYDKPDWNYIISSSMFDYLREIVCVTQKKPLKKKKK